MEEKQHKFPPRRKTKKKKVEKQAMHAQQPSGSSRVVVVKPAEGD